MPLALCEDSSVKSSHLLIKYFITSCHLASSAALEYTSKTTTGQLAISERKETMSLSVVFIHKWALHIATVTFPAGICTGIVKLFACSRGSDVNSEKKPYFMDQSHSLGGTVIQMALAICPHL